MEEYQSDDEEDRDAEDGGDGDDCTDELCPLGIVYFDLIILEGERRGGRIRRRVRGNERRGRVERKNIVILLVNTHTHTPSHTLRPQCNKE